ncbi:MAG: DUF1610 domain-containing protein [Nitrosarchaeum sp.]|nr:DUF1610 domain-containing protein [Nitrosarchaeum sp.]
MSLSEQASVANTPGAVNFLCPNCGKYEIIRSRKERETVVTYTCPECGFRGPN